MFRTHDCNSLRKGDIGKEVTLAGWINVTRDHGGVIFIDLRDREGLTQVVFRPEIFPATTHVATDEAKEVLQAGQFRLEVAKTPDSAGSAEKIESHMKEWLEVHSLRSEDVIQVSGKVGPRLPGTENPKLATGDIEVVAIELRILNRADVLPFPIDAEPQNEDLRMTHRYFDLRRPRLARNLRVLPQAPQQYKQLLMVAGVEKYFQIAKCFRDEDLRADRQPEFTQIDIEASFVTPEDIFAVTEGMLAAIFKAALNIDIKTPFDRLTYRDAVNRFGSDKPDRRFGIELVDLGEIFRESSFKVFRSALDAGGVVKAINAKGFAGITIGQADELTEIAKLHGAKGLAFIKIKNGEWKSPIVKFFSDAEKAALQSKLNTEESDCVFFGADKWEIACEVLGRIRLRVAEMQNLIANRPSGSDWDFLWVTDFPLFEWSPEENKWNAMHHPFTRPKAEDMPLFEAKKFPDVRAEAYDVVLNGVEIGGGSMRIYEPELQEKMFETLGISPEVRQSQFGHLLRALRLGAPPHGGIALGLDRLVMLVCGEGSIREVMAFPKNNRGMDLMSNSPAEVDPRQLRDLSLKLAKDKKS